MGVLAGELCGIGSRLRMRRAVRVTFHSDSGDADCRTCGEPLLYVLVPGLACGESQPPTIGVDHDADVIRVVERRCAPLERRVAEVPFGRGELPDELVEVAPVLLVP